LLDIINRFKEIILNSQIISKDEVKKLIESKHNSGCNNIDNIALIFEFLVQKIYEKEKNLKQKEFHVSSKTLTYSMMDHELDYLRKKIKVMEIEDERVLKAKSIERLSQISRSNKRSYFNFNKCTVEQPGNDENLFTKSAMQVDLESPSQNPIAKGIFTIDYPKDDSGNKENALPNIITSSNARINPTIKISELKNKNLSNLLMKKRSTVFQDKILDYRKKRTSGVAQTGHNGKDSPGAKSVGLPMVGGPAMGGQGDGDMLMGK
jgi:hypothetical protein